MWFRSIAILLQKIFDLTPLTTLVSFWTHIGFIRDTPRVHYGITMEIPGFYFGIFLEPPWECFGTTWSPLSGKLCMALLENQSVHSGATLEILWQRIGKMIENLHKNTPLWLFSLRLWLQSDSRVNLRLQGVLIRI